MAPSSCTSSVFLLIRHDRCFLISTLVYPSIHPSAHVEGEINSPNGVMCLQEMVGSGFPVAVQMSDTFLPSFTVMSEEMSYILGGTRREKIEDDKNKIRVFDDKLSIRQQTHLYARLQWREVGARNGLCFCFKGKCTSTLTVLSLFQIWQEIFALILCHTVSYLPFV